MLSPAPAAPSRTAAVRAALSGLGAALGDYARLVRLHRPVGIWLLLWPALWGLWLAARGHPHEHVFVVFVLGVVLTRSAGCAVNDFADRSFDPHVARTCDRPVAAGRVSGPEALLIYAILSLLALALVLTLDRLTVAYAIGGAALTIVYPFLKRFFPLPQVWLGAVFSLVGADGLRRREHAVPRLAWLVFVAGLMWTAVYDTMYAMVDRDDDLKLGVRSTAILFGDADRLGARRDAGADAVLAVASPARRRGSACWFRLGLAAGAALFAYQLWLIRGREPAGCFRAFSNNT